MNDPMLPLPGLSPVSGKTIVAKFDGGLLSSDGGIVVLREAEQRLRVADRLAACMVDPRAPDQITHTLADIIRFRLLMMAAGYEDGADASSLRGYPMFKMALDLTPSDRELCSQSTISRLENLPDARALLRMGRAMVDLYCESIARVEAGAEGPDTRFVVTNLKKRNARALYEDVYCRRGQAENHIKSWKTHLAADRTSCTKATANQLRLFLQAGAYWLMWGLRMGSIPACAGEPRRASAFPQSTRVYPRMCGGAVTMVRDDYAAKGLSPHVRGSPQDQWDGLLLPGSIPACAGEPSSRMAAFRRPWVYPRMCGGAHRPARMRPIFTGLSPHVRGSPARAPFRSPSEGAIPACAGEPTFSVRTWAFRRVYPRMCGGAGFANQAHNPARGLSPHVRGSRERLSGPAAAVGSIPACAGEGIVRVNFILPARAPGRAGAALFLLTNHGRARPDSTPKMAYTYLP